MKHIPWRFKAIFIFMTTVLILSAFQLNVFAERNTQAPFFFHSNQESSTPTPTPSVNAEEEDICVLTSEDCGNSSVSSPAKPEVNLEANPFADVAIILFWMEDCVHCEEVLETVFPEIEFQYNDRVSILPIELKEIESVDIFYQMAERLGVPKNNIGVPLVIIGSQVLTGNQIKADLSQWIEIYLQQNTKTILAIPEFSEQLPEAVRSRQINPEDFPGENQPVYRTTGMRSLPLLLAIGITVLGVILILAYKLFKR